MPHSRCNCRCVMCDIWKGNNNVQQLNESDVEKLLDSFRKLNTKLVVMSGGEALMHPNFFKLCDIIKTQKINICILSTGLLLKKYAAEIITKTDEVIVSLDGSREAHDKIRNIPNAFEKLKEGVQELKKLNKNYKITARCVVQRNNFRDLSNIVNAAHDIGLDQISFLAADVSTDAFNRPELWGEEKIGEVKLLRDEVEIFKSEIEKLINSHHLDFENKFIAESPEKIRRFYNYYAAFHGLNEFSQISCNAPWVSAVIEPDGTVRPCFFHTKVGNINDESLDEIVNSEKSISFRKNLDVKTNSICKKCVCSLNLSPLTKL
ncbi:MAG: radical SAM protein [Ignavibacteriaceae bacterium]|nr:radical SAM protein [Ignavibacteriaceae bacterium]MCW8823018.1 radical SAM protein [Ignavibacteriaceae bacterium]MCW8995976.1 radical SAM protein [Psychromonas sp.]MCW9094681.1 radical SAM protein [Ignavibacteriaceae bacterium]